MIPHFHGLCRGIHLAHVLAVAIVVQICLYSQQVNGYHDGISMFPHSDQQSKSATILVPYIRSRSLMKRDQRQFALQLAKPVELIYGEDLIGQDSPATADPFITVVKFQPAPHRTILVLEDYLHSLDENGLGVFEEIECQPNEVILTSAEAEETFAQWVEETLRDELQEIVVITTSEIMPGCGVKERKAFLVGAANSHGRTVNLHVTEIQWSEVATIASVEFGKVSSRPSLKKRLSINLDLSNGLDLTFKPAEFSNTTLIDLKFKPRLQIYPLPDISSSINIGPFEFPGFGDNSGQNNSTSQPGLQVTCVDCGLKGELGFSGKFDWSISDNSLEAGFITVQVKKDLVANLEMEFATGSKPFTFQFEQSIFPIIGLDDGLPLGPSFGIPQIITITPYFDYSVGVSIGVGAPETNVTFGGELRIPHGAELTWDIVHGNSTDAKGWDVEANINPPKVAKVNVTDFSLEANFTSIPAVVVKLELLNFLPNDMADVEIGAKLSMALPRLYTQSTLVTNVTGDCTTPGPDEYTYFPYGIAFNSGLELALYGEVFATAEINFSNTVSAGQGRTWTHQFWRRDYPFRDACLLFGDSKTGLGELRNTTEASAEGEQVFDLKKIEEVYKKTGKIPPEVDEQRLVQVVGLPDDLRSQILDDEKTTTTNFLTSPRPMSGTSQLQVSAWTLAILEFCVLFFEL